MIPYIVAALFVAVISSPNYVISWLPSSVNQNERDAIRAGLENTRQGIGDTSNAVVNTILRLWMDNTPPDSSKE